MKRKKNSRKAFSILATAAMTFSLLTPSVASAQTTSNQLYESFRDSNSISTFSSAREKLNARLLENFKEDNKVTFLVKFKDKANSAQVAEAARQKAVDSNLSALNAKLIQRSAVVSELKATSIDSQQSVMQFLNKEAEVGNASDITSFYIVNAIAVTATQEVAEKSPHLRK